MSDTNEDMEVLRSEVEVGWTVDITDHDDLNDSRKGAKITAVTPDGMTIRPSRPWPSQGRSFPFMNFTWDGKEVVSGRTVHLYVVGTSITSRSRPGGRRLIKTFVFHPPRP